MSIHRCDWQPLRRPLAPHPPIGPVPWSLSTRRSRVCLVRECTPAIHATVNIERGTTITSKEVAVGPRSGIGIDCWAQGPLTIGSDVMMGPECRIDTRNHASDAVDRPIRSQGFEEARPVIIEDDVWIGARVMIMPGTHVGKGSIIAAGSVVTKDVPSFTVVAGVPAHPVRKRQ